MKARVVGARETTSEQLRGRLERQRGAVAAMVVVMMVVLLGFAALVVDLGMVFRARTELQNASDSAALAGALELDRTQAGIDRARNAAKVFASKHGAHLSTVQLQDEDIRFGHWDEATRTFTDFGDDPTQASAVNSIRVIDRREEQTGDPVSHFFAPFIGHSQTDVNTYATAISGGPAAECGFPMVVPDCALDETISQGLCDYCMTFQDNNTDNAGWTSFELSSVGGPTIADLVYSACHDQDGNVAIDPTTGECAGTCNRVPAGMEIKVNNGNLMNQGGNNFCPIIQNILLRGGDPATTEPQPFTVSVPVLQSEGIGCDASQFSSWKTIAGFATLEIFGAKCANPDPGVFAAALSPCAAPPSGKYVVAALRCDLESVDGVAGGGFFGFDAKHMRLVE